MASKAQVLGVANRTAESPELLDALRQYDELVVSTPPLHVSKWLRVDLPRQAKAATGLPVTHVVGSER